MRIMHFTDLHISSRGSNMQGEKNRLYFCRKFIQFLKKQIMIEQPDVIVNGGDLTSSDVLTSEELAVTNELLGILDRSNKKVIHVLGNHERYDKDGYFNSVSMIRLLSPNNYFADTTVIKQSQEDTEIWAIPYGTSEDIIRSLNVGSGAIAFTHADLSENEHHSLSYDIFNKFKTVINGHIHNASTWYSGDTQFINAGSCLGSSFSDDYGKTLDKLPGIMIIDIDDTMTIKRIPFPEAPLYFTVSSNEELDDIKSNHELKDNTVYIRSTSDEVKVVEDGKIEKIVMKIDTQEGKEFEVKLNASIYDHLKDYYRDNKEIVDYIDKVYKGGNNELVRE